MLAELELWPNLIRAARRARAPGGDRQRPAQRAQLPRLPAAAAARAAACCGRSIWSPRRTTSMPRGFGHWAHGRGGARHRLDQVRRRQTDRGNPATDAPAPAWPAFADDDVVFLAGSTQEPEEALALATYESAAPTSSQACGWCSCRGIRSASTKSLRMLDDLAACAWQRRSRLDTEGVRPEAAACCWSIRWASWAPGGARPTIAFVGGSLGSRGGQNMIEPAAYGAAVSFGPNTRNFRDIVAQLLVGRRGRGRARRRRIDRLRRALPRRCELRSRAGSAGARLVASQLGATRRTFDLLERLVEPEGQAGSLRNRSAA